MMALSFLVWAYNLSESGINHRFIMNLFWVGKAYSQPVVPRLSDVGQFVW